MPRVAESGGRKATEWSRFGGLATEAQRAQRAARKFIGFPIGRGHIFCLMDIGQLG